MTIDAWLKNAVRKLEDSKIDSARLDAQILLADMLGQDRSWILSHPEFAIQQESLSILDEQTKRRTNHEPLAYIRGFQEFYGREFRVTQDTLTPRPETETMIELLMKLVDSRHLTLGSELQIIDVGTGSGCIIISAALEVAKLSTLNYQLSFQGVDVSVAALEVAEKNAKNLCADVDFKKFDLLNDELSSILNPQSSICVLTNLPYVPDTYAINKAAEHEPKLALFAGSDGLDFYRVLFKKLDGKTKYVFTESLEFQHTELAEIAKNCGYELKEMKDLIQCFVLEN